tara:strand:- start:26625 stop:27881 length:1257 start_codon:yes stop_codon:yes gene_type:complete
MLISNSLVKKACLLLYFYLIASIVFGQLRLDTSYTAEQFLKDWLLQSQSDLIIDNVKFTGNPMSIGAFINESPEVLMDKGIILSTGNVFDAKGPNRLSNTSTRTSRLPDADLQAIATGIVMDAVSIEFDLIALRDSIEFTYVFASEEYPEFVGRGVNDIFGFFITEIGSKALSPLNIAKLPSSSTVVSIDQVNHRRNEEFFLKSDFYNSHNTAFWEVNKEMFMRAYVFEFDGFTVPLKAVARLKSGKKYRLKMAIGDVGDPFYDSAVLIKAHSLVSKGERIPQADEIIRQTVCDRMSTIEQFHLKEDLSFDLRIHFNHDESILLKNSFSDLNALLELMNSFSNLTIEVIGHTDSDGSAERNLKLSKERAEAVKTYLLKNGIKEARIITSGMGELKALSDNETEKGKALNRRVEFRLSY